VGALPIVGVALTAPGWKMLRRSQADEALEFVSRDDADVARYEAKQIRTQAEREHHRNRAAGPGDSQDRA